MIDDAFREARSYHPSTSVLLQYEASGEPITISCDRQGLQHAFAEVILNALQANTAPSHVQVRARSETDSTGSRWAQIEVQDTGAGFSPESAGKASEPFFTTRKVGLGLGLAADKQNYSDALWEIGNPGQRDIVRPCPHFPSLGPAGANGQIVRE